MSKQTVIAFSVTVTVTFLLIAGAALRGSAELSPVSPLTGGAAGFVGSVDGSVFLVVAGNTPTGGGESVEPAAVRLTAFAIADGLARGSVELAGIPSVVVPTPGGVTVYVGYPDRTYLDAYDALTLEHQARIEPGIGPPEALSFSPDGSRLYVVSREGSVLHTLQHRRLTLEVVREDRLPEIPGNGRPHSETREDDHPAGGQAPVLPNRRGTRLYRPDVNGLGIIFAATGEQVSRVEVPAGHWRFDADRTVLWGVHQNRYPVRVTERNGDVTELRGVQVEAHPPVVVRDEVWYLAAGGGGIVRTDGLMVRLPHPAEYLVETGDGRVWAIGRSGLVTVVKPGGETETDRLLPEDTDRFVLAAAAAVVQQGGNFACF